MVIPSRSARASASCAATWSISAGDFGWSHGNFSVCREGFRGWRSTWDWLIELFAADRISGLLS
jgi:hypothetical protein